MFSKSTTLHWIPGITCMWRKGSGAFKVTNGQHNIVLHCKSIATAARTSQLLLPLKIKAVYNIQTKRSAQTIISSPLSILMVK